MRLNNRIMVPTTGVSAGLVGPVPVKRVIVVAFYFPPAGGAGVQRTVKFVRYLPGLGYAPRVVTGPAAIDGPLADGSMSKEIGDDVDVVRVAGPEPELSRGLARRAERWLLRPAPWTNWWTSGVEATVRKAAANADLLYASMSPFESAIACATLAAELDLPWVADLRDPWALDEVEVYPTRLHHQHEQGRMARLLGSASAIVMNTPEATRRLVEAFPGLAGIPVSTITNGYDAHDFDGPAPSRDDGKFRIVHSGHFLSELGTRHRRTRVVRRVLGGAHPDLDLFTRSPGFLLDALRRVVERSPALRTTIEVHLAGALSSGERALMTGAPVKVYEHGYLAHLDAVAMVRSADLLFLPMHTPAAGARATRIPGKMYEYLGAGRPILAAIPDGDARDILTRAGGALLARPADVAQMAGLIGEEIDRWRAGRPTGPPDPQVVAEFERRRLSARLAGVFDDVLATRDRRRETVG